MRLCVLATLLAVSAAPALGQGQVNVYNWSDYIAEGELKSFEKNNGIKVNYTTYDSNEILDAKLKGLLCPLFPFSDLYPSRRSPRSALFQETPQLVAFFCPETTRLRIYGIAKNWRDSGADCAFGDDGPRQVQSSPSA